jgi:hypothetical protein
VHDDNSLAIGSIKIQIAGTDAGAAHDFELVGRLKNFFRHESAATDNKRIGLGNSFDELLGCQPGLIVKLDAFSLLQNLKAFGGEFIRNQYSHGMGP